MSSKTFCKAPSERAGKQMGSFLRPVPLSPGPPAPTPSGAWAASPLSPTSHPAQVAGRGGLWRRDAEEKPVPRQFGERRWRGSRGRRELVSRPSVSFPSFPAPPAPAHRLEGHCDPDSRWEMRTKKRQLNGYKKLRLYVIMEKILGLLPAAKRSRNKWRALNKS